MPYSQKTHNFMAGCAHGMTPNKPGLKCPPKEQARKMASEGVKKPVKYNNSFKKTKTGFYH